MITIPTTELIGGLTDVIGIFVDEKAELAGVKVAWDGEALRFTAYDVYSGATVEWVPGQGAEGNTEDKNEPDWGGDDQPWTTWIRIDQVKDVIKLFKLPAKLWRVPVSVKCSPTGDRLIIEREDGPRVGRTLMLQAEHAMLAAIPDVTNFVEDRGATPTAQGHVVFAAYRLAAFGNVRAHGHMVMRFGLDGDPVGVTIGSRFAGFVYPATAQKVTRFSMLREGRGVLLSRDADEVPVP